MRAKPLYCCESSRLAYTNYYKAQAGGAVDSIPVFIGGRNQRGHGFGSLLSGLFKRAAPLLKRGLATVGKNALGAGLNIAADVLEGRNAKESARQRVSEGIKGFISDSGLVRSSENDLVDDNDIEDTVVRNAEPIHIAGGGSRKRKTNTRVHNNRLKSTKRLVQRGGKAKDIFG